MKKRWILLLIVAALAAPALAFTALYAATGTPKNNEAFAMSFSKPIRFGLILNNRTANPVYFKLNDSPSAPTCSATVYDVALDQNETLTLEAGLLEGAPVTCVGVFCADTTPTLRISGR
jgi:hypothetical protein